MSKTLDVYRDWLKIADADRPLNHYQLLRLKKFEDDLAKVREHYRKMNSFVRKYAAGEYAKESQDLLNELAKAMLCLTDTRRKSEYDASLGRKQAGSTKARSFEEILLATKVIEQPALDKARNFSKAIGVDVRDALVQQKLAKYEAVLPAYAESIGLPYLDLTDIPLDIRLIKQVPPMIARQHSCVPVMIDNKQLLMASPNPLDPNVEEELRLRFGMPVRTVLCTPANINDVLTKYVPRDGSAPEPVPAAAAEPVAAAPGQPAPAAPAAAPRPAGPLTPEQTKDRLIYSLLSLNVGTFTIVGCSQFTDLSGWISVPVGLVLAGIAFAITWNRMSRPR